MKKFKEECMTFVKEYNAIGIAVGIVIGNAVTKIVSSIASDLVMPFLGIIMPSGNWREAEVVMGRLHLKIGNFAGSLLDFIIITIVVFIFVKKIWRDEKK